MTSVDRKLQSTDETFDTIVTGLGMERSLLVTVGTREDRKLAK